MNFKKRGIALIACYLVIVVLAILGSVFLARSIGDKRIAETERSSMRAFYLAESGAEYALVQIEGGVSSGNITDSLTGSGNYNCTWNLNTGTTNQWQITSTGSVGSIARTIQLMVQKIPLPANFFGNALYSSGDVTFNGTAYDVNGDPSPEVGNVVYSGAISGDTSNVTGAVIPDSSISPLANLDYAQLREISAGQGNVYDEFRLSTDTLPGSFWFDEAAGIPNVVYVEADLTLKGNVGTVGGFFVVVGDVLTNPGVVEDTTISGNGQVDGCIYTRGVFRINGGGAGLNVYGGVWAGEEVILNGSASVTYHPEYMNAISGLSLSTDVQILSWQEL
jgi:type II secretory pathway pseudopilin PulG